MVRRVAACFFLVAALLAAAGAMVGAAPDSFCGACTKDDDCGVGHKCCKNNCPKGKYKCLKVSTCP
jgi:hypothetical protein